VNPYGGAVWPEVTVFDLKRGPFSKQPAIHELAGNAAKYGALSTPSGRLAVTWSLGDTAGGMLNFNWVETDGPPITQLPSRQGFGTVLVERTLSHEFDAIVKREFLPSGLRCSIEIPLTSEFIHAPPAGG
jgi:two-component system CheB/CheR fusion protein